MAAGEERRREALVRAPVRRLQRHLNRAVWLRALVAPLWAAVTFIAVWRFLVRFQPWVACGVALAVAVAVWIWRARKHRVGETEAAIRADRLAGVSGLLLTRLETKLGEWELELNSRVRNMKLPKAPLGRPAFLTVLAIAFLAVVLFVPAPPDRALPRNAAAANKLAEVEARAEALAKEEPLEGNMEAELARLREELESNRFDAADWEAADGLDQAMQQKAAEAAAELRNAEQAAKNLESALAKAGQQSDAAARAQEALEKSLMELSDGQAKSGDEALEQAMQQGGDSQSGDQNSQQQQGGDSQQGDQQGGDSKQGDQQSGDGQQGQDGKQGEGKDSKDGESGKQGGGGKKSVSRSQASDLKKALQQRQQQLAKSFGQEGSKGQQGDGKGEGQKQAQNGSGQGDGDGKDGDGQGQGQGQGQSGDGPPTHNDNGGPSRGGGEGVLTFDHEGEVNPDRLAFEPLPKGNGGDPDELWGLKAVNPHAQSNSASGNGVGGAAVGEQSPGRNNEKLLPRNQELIRRYFGGE